MPPLRSNKRTKGGKAEQQALRWLRQQGLCEVTCNYHCRQGEIDLIMLDGETLAFIEVRLRSSQHYGGALASVDARKQRRISLAARHYLAQHPEHHHRACRFDVIGMEPDDQKEVHYHWIQNAFYCE